MESMKNCILMAICLSFLFCAGCGGNCLALRYEELPQTPVFSIRDWNLNVENGRYEILTIDQAVEICGNMDFRKLNLPGLAFSDRYGDNGETVSVFYDAEDRVLNYRIVNYSFEDDTINGQIKTGIRQDRYLHIGLRPGALAMSEEVQRYREQSGVSMEEARREPAFNSSIGNRPAAAFHGLRYQGTDQQTNAKHYADLYSVSFMQGEIGICVTSVGLTQGEFEKCLELIVKEL